ncbi:Verru_Chthon cassette protein B [Verrucomicrobium sp. GAS474]|uniref:Verru_Chthon cassette protein B n=1 Tax=Verrucomicrobium sp. GAS474 TaxID=1882831 RepID=UPI00087BE8B6|nr:Verru_Chthon cassette protein B [Verrucomicrobium sp. GAS474]SDT95107.1 Verru_Chthon cassette protein B [Verrucomicrobium sp. GAS474]
MSNRAKGFRFTERGFSLIEVALSLGIVSFAMVSLLALIPVGLGSFQKAMKLTVEAQIVQGITADLGLKKYSDLAPVDYFYDVQGLPVTSASGRVYTASLSFRNGLSNVKGAETLDTAAGTLATIDITSTASPGQVRHYTVLVANNGQ